MTFTDLCEETNRLANYLEGCGVDRGDYVAVNTPRKAETVVAHLATWKVGAVSVPLSTLFGPQALHYRLTDCDPEAYIVDQSNLENFRDIRSETAVKDVLVVGADDLQANEQSFWNALADEVSTYDVVETQIEEAMLLMYSSGTTGQPKGILQPHRSIIGHLPGTVTNSYNLSIDGDEIWWTPSEWAWGAFLSMMIDAFFFGRPLVASESGEGFDPERAWQTVQTYGITHALLPPSALRMMRSVAEASGPPKDRHDLSSLRLVLSGGESLDRGTQEWASAALNTTVHETYGSTEMFNHIIGECAVLDPPTSDAMGKVLPGHEVTLLDPETREPVNPGEPGEIALHRDDLTLFEGYLNRPEQTREKFSGDWYLSGDIATQDEEGRFHFVSRTDDLIISSGYRIGPDEVEDVLVNHEAVQAAGVIGVPHDERGEVPKACLVLANGIDRSPDLRTELKEYVREHLATYEYPRQIEFVQKLPRTTTGKVRRTELREQDNSGFVE